MRIVSTTIVLLLAITVLAQTPTEQVNALNRLYETTNGAEWLRGNKWGSGDPCESTWEDVLCDAEFNIAGLTLGENNMVGTLPEAELFNLPGLQFLYVYSFYFF